MNRFLVRFAALGLAALLTACNLFDEDSKGGSKVVSGTDSPWIGKTLADLGNAGAMELHGGRLYVANGDTAAPGVAVVDTATGAIVEFYPTVLPTSGMAPTASGKLLLVGTDYVSGSVSVIDPAAKRIRQDVMPFGSDPGIVAAGDKTFLIDRTTGVVTGFTGDAPGSGVFLDVQTGAGTNPQDIALAGGKAWITRYDATSLLVLGDAGAIGGGARDSVDLSAYVGRMPLDSLPARLPRMASITAHDGHVFVAVQRLANNYQPRDTSLVVVIDAATKTIEKVIPLAFRNPVSAQVRDGVWYLTGIAGYGDRLGGVEKIDLVARTHAGTIVSEETLEADVFGFAPTGSAAGYVTVSTDYGFNTRVKKIAPVARSAR